jgi:hypothetical protein
MMGPWTVVATDELEEWMIGMKELRISSGGALRVLFAFDPRRTAVLLLGGDKSKGSKWNDWYPDAIQQADKLFSQYLQTQGDQGHDN